MSTHELFVNYSLSTAYLYINNIERYSYRQVIAFQIFRFAG